MLNLVHKEITGSAQMKKNSSGMNNNAGPENRKTNLIINYLPHNMTRDEMLSLFSSFGKVNSCKLVLRKGTDTYQSLGYGFVNYHRPEDAEKAINNLNGLRIQNKSLKVSYARPSSESIIGANLYINGLPKSMKQDALEKIFSPYGMIVASRIIRDVINGLCTGVGFVRFDQRVEAEEAILKLHGTTPEPLTEPIFVKFANNNLKSVSPLPPYLEPRRFNERPQYPSCRFRVIPPNLQPGSSMAAGGWHIFVYNLGPDSEEKVLWQLFGPFGAVLGVKLVQNAQTNKCRGFGFVTMANYDEAVIAIRSLNGYCLRNRVLQVSFKINKYAS